MRTTPSIGILLALSVALPAFAQVHKVTTCFEQLLAPLRLGDLQQGIAFCDQIVADKTAPPQRRGEAYAQRGLMYARQWSVTSNIELAVQGISDLTEAFRLHTPPMARQHQLRITRARLYVAIGQTRRASDDYRAVLNEDPPNAAARTGLERLTRPATQ
jgi:hypothetical protein